MLKTPEVSTLIGTFREDWDKSISLACSGSSPKPLRFWGGIKEIRHLWGILNPKECFVFGGGKRDISDIRMEGVYSGGAPSHRLNPNYKHALPWPRREPAVDGCTDRRFLALVKQESSSLSRGLNFHSWREPGVLVLVKA